MPRFLGTPTIAETSYLPSDLFKVSGLLYGFHKLLTPLIYWIVLVLGIRDLNSANAVIGVLGVQMAVTVMGRQLVIFDAYLIKNTS